MNSKRGLPVRPADPDEGLIDQSSLAPALVPMLRLHWFIRLRWVFLAAAVAALALERFIAPNIHRPFELIGVLIGLAAVNALWVAVSQVLLRHVQESPPTLRARHGRLVVFANAQVAVDLLLLTAILRYTGGVENPLAIFYLFHMVIVALLLQPWQAILQGLWALLLYGGMVVGEWQGWLVPHYPFLSDTLPGAYLDRDHVFTVLAALALGIFGMLYFTLHLAGRLEAREQELQRANAALRQAQLAIQDLQRRRSRFMQIAAHQLKAPIAVIQTLTDLIRSQIIPPDAVQPTCDKIIARCREGMVQVGELLTLARVQDADPTRHRAAQADVRQTLVDLCARFRPLADGKQVELSLRMPDEGDLIVSVDPHDLKDCIGNLIENGIKYTPGPGRVSVTVIPKRSAGHLVAIAVNVVDTGMGIDPALLRAPDGEVGHEPVFDAFRRGANVINAGISGSGLGLSIVREVVEQAGGRLLVSSRPGDGSSFTVTLPVPSALATAPAIPDTRASQIVQDVPPV